MKYLFTSILLIGLFCSCEKTEDRTIDVELTVKHHEIVQPNISIYLKKDVITFPGFDTLDYDQVKKSNDEGIVEYNNLKPGNYYLLGLGWDGIDSVYGHQPLVLNRTQLDLTIQEIMWVSEIH
ncbi:MAG: hypothetical protein AAGK97_09625 [Bacteroidota bacterium]